MADKKTLSGRVPADTYDEVEDLADDLDVRKSDLLRRATEDYLDDHGTDDRERGRSVSPLALIGVVALAIAPTLLATGYTTVGLTAGGVAAIYVLLWVTAYDVVVEDALGDARDELAEVGGVVGFFRFVMTDGRVEEPDTVVERASNWDLLGYGLVIGAGVVLAPAAVLQRVGVLDALGATGALAYAVVALGLAYAGVLLLGVSAVASLALASTRTADSADDAVAAE